MAEISSAELPADEISPAAASSQFEQALARYQAGVPTGDLLDEFLQIAQ